MNNLYCIALTHNHIPVDRIGCFHVNDYDYAQRLEEIKDFCDLQELVFLSTCNRVEFYFTTQQEVNLHYVHRFLQKFNPQLAVDDWDEIIPKCLVLKEQKVVQHLFEVASSLDSLVVGEREIITQVRNAYEKCQALHLCGDVLRLVFRQAILTAKEIYTHTQIAGKPVSIVSLAYQKLKENLFQQHARVLIIGAGQTNRLMAKFLKKHHFGSFEVFNRSLEHAQTLASELKGRAFALSELEHFTEGFDILISCTGATNHIVSSEIYSKLTQNDTGRKIIIDLSVPNDIDPNIRYKNNLTFIDIPLLQEIAAKNISERKKELHHCYEIIEHHLEALKRVYKERQVEIAMQQVPEKVKEITEHALQHVFAKEIEKLDEGSKAVLNKVLGYVEKKYISVPLKMAKGIMLK